MDVSPSWANSTGTWKVSPSGVGTRSTVRYSPLVTRYCFPPREITANMVGSIVGFSLQAKRPTVRKAARAAYQPQAEGLADTARGSRTAIVQRAAQTSRPSSRRASHSHTHDVRPRWTEV